MDLYIAIRGFKRGKVFDFTEDGLEEMVLRKENGREVPSGYTGLIIPFAALKDDVIRLARKGQQVDKRIYAQHKPH